ncbi:MAG: nucleotide exchange factor GrpE [Nitrososphaerales archaeon]
MLTLDNNLKQDDPVDLQREGEKVEKIEKGPPNDVKAKANVLEDLRKDLELEKKKSESLTNRLLYAQADLENYRKQVSKEFEEQSRFGKREIIRKLIDVKDDISRALDNIDGADLQNVANGLKIIVANVDGMLAEEGVQTIEAIGKKFDPNLHEAVSFSSPQEGETGMVVSEVKKGYMIHDRVLRPSMVSVVGDSGESKEREVDSQSGGD